MQTIVEKKAIGRKKSSQIKRNTKSQATKHGAQNKKIPSQSSKAQRRLNSQDLSHLNPSSQPSSISQQTQIQIIQKNSTNQQQTQPKRNQQKLQQTSQSHSLTDRALAKFDCSAIISAQSELKQCFTKFDARLLRLHKQENIQKEAFFKKVVSKKSQNLGGISQAKDEEEMRDAERLKTKQIVKQYKALNRINEEILRQKDELDPEQKHRLQNGLGKVLQKHQVLDQVFLRKMIQRWGTPGFYSDQDPHINLKKQGQNSNYFKQVDDDESQRAKSPSSAQNIDPIQMAGEYIRQETPTKEEIELTNAHQKQKERSTKITNQLLDPENELISFTDPDTGKTNTDFTKRNLKMLFDQEQGLFEQVSMKIYQKHCQKTLKIAQNFPLSQAADICIESHQHRDLKNTTNCGLKEVQKILHGCELGQFKALRDMYLTFQQVRAVQTFRKTGHKIPVPIIDTTQQEVEDGLGGSQDGTASNEDIKSTESIKKKRHVLNQVGGIIDELTVVLKPNEFKSDKYGGIYSRLIKERAENFNIVDEKAFTKFFLEEVNQGDTNEQLPAFNHCIKSLMKTQTLNQFHKMENQANKVLKNQSKFNKTDSTFKNQSKSHSKAALEINSALQNKDHQASADNLLANKEDSQSNQKVKIKSAKDIAEENAERQKEIEKKKMQEMRIIMDHLHLRRIEEEHPEVKVYWNPYVRELIRTHEQQGQLKDEFMLEQRIQQEIEKKVRPGSLIKGDAKVTQEGNVYYKNSPAETIRKKYGKVTSLNAERTLSNDIDEKEKTEQNKEAKRDLLGLNLQNLLIEEGISTGRYHSFSPKQQSRATSRKQLDVKLMSKVDENEENQDRVQAELLSEEVLRKSNQIGISNSSSLLGLRAGDKVQDSGREQVMRKRSELRQTLEGDFKEFDSPLNQREQEASKFKQRSSQNNSPSFSKTQITKNQTNPDDNTILSNEQIIIGEGGAELGIVDQNTLGQRTAEQGINNSQIGDFSESARVLQNGKLFQNSLRSGHLQGPQSLTKFGLDQFDLIGSPLNIENQQDFARFHQAESEKALPTWRQNATEEVEKLKKASKDVLLKDIRNQRFKGTRLVDLALQEAKDRKYVRKEREQKCLTPKLRRRQLSTGRNSRPSELANNCQTKLASFNEQSVRKLDDQKTQSERQNVAKNQSDQELGPPQQIPKNGQSQKDTQNKIQEQTKQSVKFSQNEALPYNIQQLGPFLNQQVKNIGFIQKNRQRFENADINTCLRLNQQQGSQPNNITHPTGEPNFGLNAYDYQNFDTNQHIRQTEQKIPLMINKFQNNISVGLRTLNFNSSKSQAAGENNNGSTSIVALKGFPRRNLATRSAVRCFKNSESLVTDSGRNTHGISTTARSLMHQNKGKQRPKTGGNTSRRNLVSTTRQNQQNVTSRDEGLSLTKRGFSPLQRDKQRVQEGICSERQIEGPEGELTYQQTLNSINMFNDQLQQNKGQQSRTTLTHDYLYSREELEQNSQEVSQNRLPDNILAFMGTHNLPIFFSDGSRANLAPSILGTDQQIINNPLLSLHQTQSQPRVLEKLQQARKSSHTQQVKHRFDINPNLANLKMQESFFARGQTLRTNRNMQSFKQPNSSNQQIKGGAGLVINEVRTPITINEEQESVSFFRNPNQDDLQNMQQNFDEQMETRNSQATRNSSLQRRIVVQKGTSQMISASRETSKKDTRGEVCEAENNAKSPPVNDDLNKLISETSVQNDENASNQNKDLTKSEIQTKKVEKPTQSQLSEMQKALSAQSSINCGDIQGQNCPLPSKLQKFHPYVTAIPPEIYSKSVLDPAIIASNGQQYSQKQSTLSQQMQQNQRNVRSNSFAQKFATIGSTRPKQASIVKQIVQRPKSGQNQQNQRKQLNIKQTTSASQQVLKEKEESRSKMSQNSKQILRSRKSSRVTKKSKQEMIQLQKQQQQSSEGNSQKEVEKGHQMDQYQEGQQKLLLPSNPLNNTDDYLLLCLEPVASGDNLDLERENSQ